MRWAPIRAAVTAGRKALRRVGAPSVVLVATVVVVSACGSEGDRPGGIAQLHVVATTTIVGDIVGGVVGDAAEIEVLIPLGVDPHDYQVSARQISHMVEADLVVANGLLLEEGLTDVLEGAAADGADVLELAPSLDPLPFAGGSAEGLDPHFWLDPVRVADAARHVADRLAVVEPAVDWADRAEDYAATLMEAHEAAGQILAGIPAERRKLVTNHDAFGYFAARYGFEIVGVVIPGGSTLADPSSAELSRLVETIRRENVRAIFTETTEQRALADAVAAELGLSIQVVQLHGGSLGGPGTDTATLAGMLVDNAQRIAEALS